MLPKFRIISFYTLNTPYEKVFYEYLWPTIHKFKLDWVTTGYHSENSWNKNTSLKPGFILNSFQTNYNPELNRFVFLDADATIEQYPQLFHEIPEEYDIACHYLDWSTWYPNGQHKKELLSGTMYLRDSKAVRELVTEWDKRAKASTRWEQNILQELLLERPEIKVYDLPLQYCYIKTLPSGHAPLVQCDNIVITHHQVSRIYKKVMDKI
jgi:hypothetical protein